MKMISGCHNCLFNAEELVEWYGCIWSDGTHCDGCGNWIPDDEAMAQLQEERKNWRKTYEKRRSYNSEVPEEKRLVINREGEVLR